MKKALQIFGAVLLFFVFEFLVSTLAHLLHLQNPTVNNVLTFLLEALLLAVFVFLNLKIFKQKILLDHYPIGKGIGISWLAIFYLIGAVSLAIAYQRSVGLIIYSLIFALLIGCTEEYIFRGMIFGSLISQGKSVFYGIAVSSILFGLTHGINLTHNSLYNVGLQVLYTIPMGVLLATIYLKSNNLIYCILLHAATDFSGFLANAGSVNSTKARHHFLLL